MTRKRRAFWPIAQSARLRPNCQSLVPVELKDNTNVRTKVALGDPTKELLYGARAQNASFIVLGAPGASHFAAITRAGIVYKVLAFAHCPVITLSPVVLNACETKKEGSLL
jgi:nucleotide-binding universal stress UspA family protein